MKCHIFPTAAKTVDVSSDSGTTNGRMAAARMSVRMKARRTTKMVHNRYSLSQAETVRLGLWISKHAETLRAEQPTMDQAARQAESELGFPVTKSHIETVREAAGVTWSSRNASRGPGKLSSKTYALARVVEKLWSELYTTVAGTLLVPISPTLLAILRNRSEEDVHAAYMAEFGNKDKDEEDDDSATIRPDRA